MLRRNVTSNVTSCLRLKLSSSLNSPSPSSNLLIFAIAFLVLVAFPSAGKKFPPTGVGDSFFGVIILLRCLEGMEGPFFLGDSRDFWDSRVWIELEGEGEVKEVGRRAVG